MKNGCHSFETPTYRGSVQYDTILSVLNLEKVEDRRLSRTTWVGRRAAGCVTMADPSLMR